jgi:hypothetical protein
MSPLWILGLIPLILLSLIIYEQGTPAVLGIAGSVGLVGAIAMTLRQNWAAITEADWLTPALIAGGVVYGATKLRGLVTRPGAAGAFLLVALSACSTPTAPATTTAGPVAAEVLVVPASSHVTGVYPTSCKRGPGEDLRLPLRACTPGSVRDDVDPAHLELTVCKPGWSDTIRPSTTETNRVKTFAMGAYGVPPELRSRTELDHDIPLSMGGSSHVTNLWPEVSTRPVGFRNDKDDVEDHVRAAVCHHRVTWRAAITALADDWTTTETKLGIKRN